MGSASSDNLIESRGAGNTHTPKISGTTKGMTMKFLPDVGIYMEAQNQKTSFT